MFVVSVVRMFTVSCFYCCHYSHVDLHSFPTRRSSDLGPRDDRRLQLGTPAESVGGCLERAARRRSFRAPQRTEPVRSTGARNERSEEHTSELQSRFDLVCRLLLEKKKDTSYR